MDKVAGPEGILDPRRWRRGTVPLLGAVLGHGIGWLLLLMTFFDIGRVEIAWAGIPLLLLSLPFLAGTLVWFGQEKTGRRPWASAVVVGVGVFLLIGLLVTLVVLNFPTE